MLRRLEPFRAEGDKTERVANRNNDENGSACSPHGYAPPGVAWERRGHRFARYADDFVILVKRLRSGERVMASVRRFLETKLKVNEGKSQVVKTSALEFLGTAQCGSSG